MVFVVVFVLGLVGWVLIAGVSKGKARRAEAEQRSVLQIMNDLREEPNQKPNWAHDRNRLREFAHAVGRLAERRGVPLEFIQQFLAEDASIHWLMHYMAILERRGVSFAAQEIAAADHILSQWFLIPMAQQRTLMDAELTRKVGR